MALSARRALRRRYRLPSIIIRTGFAIYVLEIATLIWSPQKFDWFLHSASAEIFINGANAAGSILLATATTVYRWLPRKRKLGFDLYILLLWWASVVITITGALALGAGG